MSVVVRMEMPKACSWIENGEKKRCPIAEWGGACAITKQFKMPDGCRPSWCPIICQLPEGHGRLGDLDELCDGLVSNHTVVIHAKNALTIVPAEAERKVNASDAVAPTDTPTDTPTVPAERSEHERTD